MTMSFDFHDFSLPCQIFLAAIFHAVEKAAVFVDRYVQNAVCDVCGSELIKRNDDNLESFKIRYNSFVENTKPLIEYYDNKGKLRKIDVNRNVEDIFKDIVDVIK